MQHKPTRKRQTLTGGRLVLRPALAPRDVKQARAAGWRKAPPTEVIDKRSSIPDLLRAHVRRLAKEKSRSIRDVETIISCHVAPAFDGTLVVDLGLPDVTAWIEHSLRPFYSSGTVHCIVSVLRAALTLAQQKGVVSANVCASIPRWVLPLRSTRPGFDAAAEVLAPEQLARVLGRVRGADLISYAFAGLAGLRVGEISEARWRDIAWTDEPLACLTISRSWSRKNHRVQPTKTGAIRRIPIHPALRGLLNRWAALGWRETYRRAPRPEDLIIPRRLEGLLVQQNDRTLLRRWHEALESVGLAKRRLHSLRHTFVSTLLAAGADWRAVERMTHPTTRWRGGLSVYAHFQWPALCAAVSRLEIDLGGGSQQLELFGQGGIR